MALVSISSSICVVAARHVVVVELRLELSRDARPHLRRDLRVREGGHGEHEAFDRLREPEPFLVEADVGVPHVIASAGSSTPAQWTAFTSASTLPAVFYHAGRAQRDPGADWKSLPHRATD